MLYDEAALQNVRETRLLIDRYDKWIFGEFKPYLGRKVVEVGCGLGNQLRLLTDRDFVMGIEPFADVVEQTRTKFRQFSNIEIQQHSITEESVLSLAHHKFDTAISLNVFEHIDDDELAMRNTRVLLRKGGTFILIVPAHMSLYGEMDKSIGHYRRYDKDMMASKMKRAGFNVISQKYLNMVGALGWGVNGRLLKKKVPPTGQLKILNALVPALRTVEGTFGAPFGISLMCIAERM